MEPVFAGVFSSNEKWYSGFPVPAFVSSATMDEASKNKIPKKTATPMILPHLSPDISNFMYLYLH
jgi:hypothetical protein